MYLVGESHPNKVEAQRLLETCILDGERLVTDAEVLQEILHRYAAIHRMDAVQPAFDALLGVVDEIFPVDLPLVERAKTILLGKKRISARDALHIAVMQAQEVSRILSFDTGFDGIPGITRLHS
jgi:predicted nucleic acid-binding protein